MTKPPRTAHVKRIYPSDEDGKVTDTSIWIDVLRIDDILLNYRGMRNGIQHTDFRYHFKWLDDKDKDRTGDDQGEKGNKARKFQSLSIHDPELPDDETDSDISLPLVWKQHIHLPTQYYNSLRDWIPSTGWFFQHVHDNAPADGSGPDPGNAGAPTKPSKRDVTKARVTNVDLGDFDMSKPVKWDDYKQALQDAISAGKADKSQYVDTEILKRFRFTYAGRTKGLPGEVYASTLQNKDLVKLIDAGGQTRQGEDPEPSDPAGTPNRAGQVPKLYRLDPLQTIVNVNWGDETVAVIFKPTWDWAYTTDSIPCEGGGGVPGVEYDTTYVIWASLDPHVQAIDRGTLSGEPVLINASVIEWQYDPVIYRIPLPDHAPSWIISGLTATINFPVKLYTGEPICAGGFISAPVGDFTNITYVLDFSGITVTDGDKVFQAERLVQIEVPNQQSWLQGAGLGTFSIICKRHP